MSANNVCTTSLSRSFLSTSRRLCNVPFLAWVISFSAYGRSARAFGSVVLIRPCSNSAVARLANIAFWCEDDPPRRGPLVGLGIGDSLRYGPARGTGLRLFGFGVVLVVVLLIAAGFVAPGAARRVVAGDLGRIEPGRAVLEGQTELVQLDLHLVDGLLAEVPDVEQVGLGTGDQFPDGVDPLPLEAVVGPHGQIQVVDRQRERRDVVGLGRRRADLDAFRLDVELPGQPEQLDEGLTGGRDRVPRADRRLGLDVEDQLVEVGALLD